MVNRLSTAVYRALLLAWLMLLINACGGGGGSSPPEPPPNASPQVSISGDAAATEKETVTLTANASDSDGTISSYQWTQLTGPTVSLGSTTGSSLALDLPDIEANATFEFRVTVRDNDGATATANFSIDVSRISETITLTAAVVDEPLPNASVRVDIGDEFFTTTTDANGNYVITFEVDERNFAELIKLTAEGDPSTHPGVKLVTIIASINTIKPIAGDDTLSADEEFGLTITNITTAKIILMEEANSGMAITTEQELENLSANLDEKELYELAAAIKIIVDDENYSLPNGVNDTLEYFSDETQRNQFFSDLANNAPTLITTVIRTIIQDANLVGIESANDDDFDDDGVTNDNDAFPTDASESVDTDGDGIGNNADTDDDGDGVLDGDDAFPLDASETVDTDGDGIGNNADDDDDGDGVLDGNDAFPLDAAESVDTDSDGIGNNADTDDDGDGVLDGDDAFPLDAAESVDTDGDGIGNNVDTDDDGDGVADVSDAFPLDATESVDTDGDGVGNNADNDDDNDGVDDSVDAFPLDATEDTDTDGDGVGNNTDDDDDGDGVNDSEDAFPLDETETLDTDGDGVGNNADTDDDNDQVLDENDGYPLIPIGDLQDTDNDGIPDDCDADCQATGMEADDDDNGNGIPDDEELTPILVSIDTPESLITVGTSPIRVSGTATVDAKVFLNGVEVDNVEGTFEGDVSLEEGSNSIEARAVMDDNVNTDLITVSLDKTPPYLTIDSHEDGETVYEPTITVTGLVNDIVRGTIEEDQANVTVNGATATIKNRSYSVAEVELSQGPNTITIEGSDQVGNIASINLTITYQVLSGDKIEIASGQNQEGTIEDTLGSPLTVRVLNQAGEPIEGESVVFRVSQGSGAVGAGGSNEGRAIVVDTDADGLASTDFKLGSRSGVSNHKVEAAVVGITGGVSFNASAVGRLGNKLSVNSGNNQRGVIFNNLPEPFVTVVTDSGANVVEGARVRFEMVSGEGEFSNGEEEITVETDSDGRATAQYKLGNKTGLDAQRIQATLLDALDDQLITAGFTASAFAPQGDGDTTITGVVLDNQDQPIPNVTIRIENSTREAVTDANGQFTVEEAPVGPVHLIADGSTVTDGGEYPALSYNIVTIAGTENPLSAPIYMVKLDTDNAVFAGPQDVILEMDEYPGFKLEIAKDSVTFPDGSREGLVSVTSVNASKVPMAPPNGMQPQFIVTIQPSGTLFDPPARLSLPNVDAHPPGAQVEMYSYDHDLEEFVSIGIGTTSEDGSVVESNPGVGVVKAGWHCGSQPQGSGCCGGGGGGPGGCPTCQKREGANCDSGGCVPDDSQDPGDCKKCGGGSPVPDDSETPTGPNGKCEKCEGGEKKADESKNGNKCGEGDKQACYTCKDGKCGNHCEADPDKSTFTLTSGDLAGLDSVVDKLKNAGKILPGPLEVTDASASLALSGSRETGEKCCQECSEGKPLKSAYTKYEGKYDITASVKIGLKGTTADFTDLIPFTYTRLVFSYAIGPFLEIKGTLGNKVSYETSDCEEGNCLTVGVSGSLGAELSVGGSVKIGYDTFDPKKCPTGIPSVEADKEDTKCFGNFRGGIGEAWAVGGSALKAEIAVSNCPGGDKCEVGLDKVAGKVFVKASVDLTFFKYEYENVITEGTLFEGATASCLPGG